MCRKMNYVLVSRGPGVERIPVPCKKCWECKADRKNDFVGRCLAEKSVSDWCVHLTLTYRTPNDGTAPHKVVTPRHFQDFVRLLRRSAPRNVRYIVAGEYGDMRGRAHFHAILFGKGEKPKAYVEDLDGVELADLPEQERCWMDEWQHGHVYAEWLPDARAMGYVCKYANKNDQQDIWFSMSKKPVLGWEWFKAKADRHIEAGVMPRSFNYQPPGGKKKTGYWITGATRREFLARIVTGLKKKGQLQLDRLSNWVGRMLAKYEGEALQKRVSELELTRTLEEWKEALAQKGRMAKSEMAERYAVWLARRVPKDDAERIRLGRDLRETLRRLGADRSRRLIHSEGSFARERFGIETYSLLNSLDFEGLRSLTLEMFRRPFAITREMSLKQAALLQRSHLRRQEQRGKCRMSWWPMRDIEHLKPRFE